MMFAELCASASIALLLLTGVVHSVGGEVYLIRPLFKYRGNRVLENSLARMVIRFAWHITSLMWALLAGILYTAVFAVPHLGDVTLIGIGVCFVGVGLFDLFASKGRHIGWPLLTLIGVFALMAAYFAR